MSGRFTTLQWTTGSVLGASGSLEINQAINANHIDFVKFMVAPNSGAGTSKVEIYKRDTFLITDRLYRTKDFAGTLIDRLEDDGTATAEALEGEPIPYDDDDSTKELHLKIYNNDSSARTYTVTLKYQEPVIAIAGNVTLPANLTVQGANGINISSVAPILDFTDTTGGSKSLRIAVDNNFADFIERTAALGSLLRLDIGNNRVGIGATPSSLFEISNLILPTMTINNPLTTLGIDSSNTARIDFKGITDPGVNNSAQIKYRIEMHQYEGGGPYVNFRIRDMKATPVPVDRIIINYDGRVGNTADNILDQPGGLGLSTGPGASGFGWKVDSSGYIAAFENTNVNVNCAGVLIKSAGTVGATAILTCASGGLIRLTLFDDGQFHLPDNLLAEDGPGRFIKVGRNFAAVSPGAGAINLVGRAGAANVIWGDNTGTLRIGGSRPTFSTDTSGVVVGTQASRLEDKNILREWKDPFPALEEILKTRVFDFQYKNGSFNNETFTGIISDYSPLFGQDKGKSFNSISSIGYCILAIQALHGLLTDHLMSRHGRYSS
jgi:hypothetical protein